MKNPYRTYIQITFLMLALLSVGYAFEGRQGLLICFFFCLGLIYLMFFGLWRHLHRVLRAQAIEGRDPWNLRDTVQKLCTQLKLKMPPLYLLPTDTPILGIVHTSFKTSALIISQGLLQKMAPNEIESLLGCHLVIIKKEENLSSSLASALLATVLSPAIFLDWLIQMSMDRVHRKWSQTHLFVALVSPLCSLIVKICTTQQTLYSADARSADLISSQEVTAQALWKVWSYSMTQTIPIPFYCAPLFLVNPLTSLNIGRYFHGQPTVEKRILRLIGRFPL